MLPNQALRLNIKPPGAEYKLCLLQRGQRGLGDGTRVAGTNLFSSVCIPSFRSRGCPSRTDPAVAAGAPRASDRAITHGALMAKAAPCAAPAPGNPPAPPTQHHCYTLPVQLPAGFSSILQFFRKARDSASVERE